MTNIILWSSVGILVLALLIGLGVGLIRGVKRSGMHIIFLVVSIVVAFLLTKTVTKAILGITLPLDNGRYTVSEYIIYVISKSFDISAFDSASTFITNLPNAIVAPILFILLSLVVYLLFDIAYLITARLVFGKKKEDFKEKKPYRAFGGVIGLVEGLFVVIMMFGPLSSLTGTYNEIVHASSISTSVAAGDMKTIPQYAQGALPTQLDEALLAWDKSVCGKLPKIFGLNNALFDNLSSFKVKGEKIVVRKEITNFAYAYDDFVEIYNLARKKEYSKIYMGNFRSSLNYLLDGNFFEVVICDTIDSIVSDYENMKAKLPFTPPVLMDEIVGEMSTTFKQKGFDAARYIKQDIKSVVNTVEVIFTNDLITKYNAIANKSDFIEILDFISANNTPVKTVANNIISLNLVEDSFNILIDKASKEVEKVFAGKEYKVALNTDIQDKSAIISNLLGVVDSVIDVNKDIEISKILTTNDIVETLTSVESISKTMVKIGDTFDKVRNLEILIIPPEQEGGNEIYVFDNILKNYGVDLLGDEVYLTSTATEKTTLDTYAKFFNFIAGPIDVAKDLGLTDFGKDGVTFDSILDKVLFSLKYVDEGLLTRVVMPFYQLNAMDLKHLVFDTVVENLRNNVSFLTFDELIATNDYHAWAEEFDLIGNTLNQLNTGRLENGTSEIEGYDNTYIKYLLSEGADLEKMMKAMLDNNRLAGVLNNVFSSKVFEGLTGDIFKILDDNVKSLTGTTSVDISTNWKDNLKQTKENTIETIEGILKLVLSENQLSISDYGKVLNLLKVNAANGGQKNGVFNNIFVNIIWYMTGEDLTEGKIYASLVPHGNAKDINAFLNISDYYAEGVDFEARLAEAEKAINLAKKIEENVDFTISPDNSISNIVGGIEASLAEMTEEEKVKTINDLQNLLENKNETLLDDSYGQEEREELNAAISEKFGNDSEVGQALKNLLGI